MYRIVCKFVPSIKYTPTGGRFGGAWRVVACMQATTPSMAVAKPVMVLYPHGRDFPLLVLSSPSRRQPNAWCSPRKILAEWQDARALVRTQLAACRRWEDNTRYITSQMEPDACL